MTHTCKNPQCLSTKTKKTGTYTRHSDHQTIQRYRCQSCNKTFSEATGTICFAQKKRQINNTVLELFASGLSQNRMSRILTVTRKTIVRKLKFLGTQCSVMNAEIHKNSPKAERIIFDELETFEHTKCKPLSVAVCVEDSTRRILGFNISTMPAKGRLAKVSLKKYGKRKDQRSRGLTDLLRKISPYCESKISIVSDKCPRYAGIVKKTLGKSPERIQHFTQYKGARSSATGQGELKKIKFDPLFAINHTLAMLRANINRLFRQTWNTTKRQERLAMHLEIYTFYHNSQLIYYNQSPQPHTSHPV